VQAGVIDPAKVVCSALQHAASIASLLLATEAVISQTPEEHKHAAVPGGGFGRRQVLNSSVITDMDRAPVSLWTAQVQSEEGITLTDGPPQEK
jgi:hypothetical protein